MISMTFKKATSVALVGIFFTNCGVPRNPESKINQIVGTDDRVEDHSPISETSIGSLEYLGEPLCTAFATGPHQITTAYHCIAEFEQRIVYGEFSFKTKLNTYAIFGIGKTNKNADYAILTVDPKISNWFEVKELEPHEPLSIYSATSDGKILTNTVEKYSEIIANGYIKYGLDTVRGASGSPILQNGAVIAVHLGAYRDGNLGILMSQVENVDEIKILKEGLLEQVGLLITLTIAVVELADKKATKIAEKTEKIIIDSRKLREAEPVSFLYRVKDLPKTWSMKDRIYEVETEYKGSRTFVNLDQGKVSVCGYVDRTTCKGAVEKAADKETKRGKPVELEVIVKAIGECDKEVKDILSRG